MQLLIRKLNAVMSPGLLCSPLVYCSKYIVSLAWFYLLLEFTNAYSFHLIIVTILMDALCNYYILWSYKTANKKNLK